MNYTNYKQMIEDSAQEFAVQWVNRNCEYEGSENRFPLVKETIKDFAIKSIDEEIKWLESKIQDIDKAVPHSQHKFAILGYNQATQHLISCLLLEKSRINEEE